MTAIPTTDLTAKVADAAVFGRAAQAISVPRAVTVDSFLLHAPLELLARNALLPHASPERRGDALGRIGALSAAFLAAGPPVATCADGKATAGGGTDLCDAVLSGDVARADTLMQGLARSSTAEELVGHLADLVVGRLAAAAHGAIFLYLLPRVAPRSGEAAMLGRGIVRELASDPAARVRWVDHRQAAPAKPGSLAAALASPPSPGDPGSLFIDPTMSIVDTSGLARDLLDGPTRGLPVADARTTLLRVAAHSMLQDAPTHARYGWTHCLTLAQATLGVATHCVDPQRAVAVAATYVLGFRATLGSTHVDMDWEPATVEPSPPESMLTDGPAHAAAVMWHAEDRHRGPLLRQVVDAAATHHDAHLAKYTLACLDAARDDPEAAHLFHAAAAHLAACWVQDVTDA